MKKYLKNIIIFSIPIFFTFMILEYYTRDYNTLMKQKQTYLSNNSDTIEVLILGNSHAGDGLNPVPFTLNAFNAAQGSQSLYFDIEITKKYLSSMRQLKYVLISIDYHSFYFTHTPQRNFMYSNYYNINYKDNVPLKSRFSLLFFGYGIKDGLSMLRKTPHIPEKGWIGHETTEYNNLNDFSGKKKVDFFNKMVDENRHNKGEIINNLNIFIKLLKNNNITPILFTLPCHNFFIDNLNNEIISQNKTDIKNICKENDIKYLNYLNEDLTDNCFYNLDHLNKKGALIISKKINSDIMLFEEAVTNQE